MAAQPRSSKKSTKHGRKKSPSKATSSGTSSRGNSSSQRKPVAPKVRKTAQGKKVATKTKQSPSSKTSKKFSRTPLKSSSANTPSTKTSLAKSTGERLPSSATSKKTALSTKQVNQKKSLPQGTSPHQPLPKTKNLPKVEKTPETSTTHGKKASKKASAKIGLAKKSSAKKSSAKKSSSKKTSALSQPTRPPPTATDNGPKTTKKTSKSSKSPKSPKTTVPPQQPAIQVHPVLNEINAALDHYSKLRRSSEQLVNKLRRIDDVQQIAGLFKLFSSDEDPFGLRSSVILTLEAFPEDAYYTGLLGALPQLVKRCPAWGFVMLLRLVNTRGYPDDAWKRFVATLTTHPPRTLKVVQTLLEEHREQTSSDISDIIQLALGDLLAAQKSRRT